MKRRTALLLLALSFAAHGQDNKVLPITTLSVGDVTLDYTLTQPGDCVTENGMTWFAGSDGMVGWSTISCDAAYVAWLKNLRRAGPPLWTI